MLKVNKNGALEAPLFSEGSAGRFKIKIQGTGLNNSGPRQVYVNGVAKYDATGGRGLRLSVFDYNMTSTFDATYDVYGTETARADMAAKINEIMATPNVLFTITSWDAIGTNAALTTAMTNARSTEFIRYVTGAGRFPYAAFGSSKHGIVKEVCYPQEAKYPFAIIETSFESINSLGRTGYGPLLANTSDPISATSGYSFYQKHLGVAGTGPNDIWEDDYIWLKCQARVSPDRAAANGKIAMYIYATTDAGEWGRSASISIGDTEWTDVNLFLRRDPAWRHGTSGKPELNFAAGIYHYPSNISVGKSEFRNLTVIRSGVSPTASSFVNRVIASDHILSARGFHEGLPFDLFNRDSYWEIYSSAQNLYTGVMPADMLNGGATAEPVKIFTRTLANADCTRYSKLATDASNANTQFLLPIVSIKPDTPYLAAIWVKSEIKTAGSLYFGMYTYDVKDTQVGSLQRATATVDSNQYFNIHSAAEVANNGLSEWRLMVGLILPESWTAAQVTEFVKADISSDRMFASMIVAPNAGGQGFFKLANSTAKLRLRFLDYYNGNAVAKSQWAMPMLIPLNTLRMSKRDGVNAFRLKEI